MPRHVTHIKQATGELRIEACESQRRDVQIGMFSREEFINGLNCDCVHVVTMDICFCQWFCPIRGLGADCAAVRAVVHQFGERGYVVFLQSCHSVRGPEMGNEVLV